ncbi:four helix bundle protein [Patescibacteria group bacterium]|nr:four helix bundle protein [Patescibacteria group bacterium]
MNQELSKIKTFQDLKAWQEAHKLVTMIYQETKNFPKEEIFGLVSQMRRCVISISSNIAHKIINGLIKKSKIIHNS